MASHIGVENVKSFLDKIAKRVTGVIDIKEAIDSLGLLVSQLDEADLNGTPEGIKGLYVLDFLMSNTPLSKYLAFHGLIKPITQQIEQLDKVLNEKNCSFWAGPVKLSIFEEGGWLAFDREMSEIEQVQLFPIKLTYGDGVTATSEFVSLEKRAKNPITLTQKSGVWTYNSSDIAAMGSIFLDSLHLYCGAWMVAAKAGNKMYYGRTTIRNNGNSPSTIVISPSN